MANTMRFVVRLLDGRHQPATIDRADISFASEGGSFQVLTPSLHGSTAVIEFPLEGGLLSVGLGRDKSQFPTLMTYRISSSGDVTKDRSLIDTQIRGKRQDGDRTVVDVDLVDSNVIALDPNTYGAFTSSSSGWSWAFPAAKVKVATDSIERDGEISFADTATVQPQIYVFAIKHLPRPKLIGVAVPNNVTQLENVLLFYHHTLSQNASAYKGAAYPLSEAYIRYGLYNYFSGDRALAYQLAAANKKLAMVLPVPELGPGDNKELGDFDKNPVVIQSVLEELIAHFNRRFRSDFAAPVLKEMAVGHYSGGILHTKNLMKAAGPLTKLITEIYDIDGLFSSYGAGLNSASFAGNGRVIRSYTQIGTTIPKNFADLAKRNIYAISFDRWKKLPSPLHFTVGPKLTLTQAKQSWVHAAAPGGLLHHALSKRSI